MARWKRVNPTAVPICRIWGSPAWAYHVGGVHARRDGGEARLVVSLVTIVLVVARAVGLFSRRPVQVTLPRHRRYPGDDRIACRSPGYEVDVLAANTTPSYSTADLKDLAEEHRPGTTA